MTLGGGAVWSEPRLAIKAATAGSLDPATRQPAQVASARVQLDADGDALMCSSPARSICRRHADVAGDAPCDRQRGALADAGAAVVRARPWQIDGQSEVAADLRAAASTVEVSQAKVIVSNCVSWARLVDYRATCRDSGDVHWNGATGEIASRSAQVVSSSSRSRRRTCGSATTASRRRK